jgi:hypothetical protein
MYYEIKLPTDIDKLIGCYMYLTAKIRALWVEYVGFVETAMSFESTFLYRVVFSEMEFYEDLRVKVTDRLPERTVKQLRGLDDYSSW